MNKNISIIIPVYNAGQYLARCLDSCLLQDLPKSDYEIIAVNDGSTDTSMAILNDYSSKHKNISVINKLNGGPGSARNAGLKTAQGKYIWFVDADDWIEENCLGKIVRTLENDQLDALQIGYYKVKDGNIDKCDEKYQTVTQAMGGIEYVNYGCFFGGVCGTIFKLEIAKRNNIIFNEGICISEDHLFFLSIFHFIEKVKRNNYMYYYYTSNATSLTNTKGGQQILESINNMAAFQYRKDYIEYIEELMITHFFVYAKRTGWNLFKLHKTMENIQFKNNCNPYTKSRKLFDLYLKYGILFLFPFALLLRTKTGLKELKPLFS